MKIAKLLVVGAVISMATAAEAKNGFYIGLGGGLASVSDVDILYYDAGGTFGGSGARDTASGAFDLKSAAAFRGTLGYDFGMVRADVEIDYSRNKVSGFTIGAVNGTAVTLSPDLAGDICDYLETDGCAVSGNTIGFDGGRVRQLSALANVWVDLPIGNSITPYVGGGLGVSGFEIDGEGKGRFAWQLGAGVAVPLSDGFDLTLDYRYRQAGRSTIAYDASSGFEIGKVKTNSITAGVRFTF